MLTITSKLAGLLRGAVFCILCILSSYALAHKGAWSDPFAFDNTNEGEKPAVFQKGGTSAPSGECTDGMAAGYPCKNVDLSAIMPRSEMGGDGAFLNDIWGWTDPVTGREIAIVGRENGTSFVDVTDPLAPEFLGFLPTHGGQTGGWRDIKVYGDHALIVADSTSSSVHGLQIFDLSQLFNMPAGSTLEETTHLDGFGAAHNIAVNEDSGFAYVVGSDACSGGLFMVDVSDPSAPGFAGCYSADGYTHDAQCVNYEGPDTRYTDAEICFAYNEDTVTIVDVTNKSNPLLLSRTSYPGVGYTHQGWLINDAQTHIAVNDEADETRGTVASTTTLIFDVSRLDAPTLAGRYLGPTGAIDHNLYSKNGLIFESNYRAGLRVLGEIDIAQGCFDEVALFDTIPNSDSPQFSGAWSSYIEFASGHLVLSDIESGLFVLAPDQAGIDTEIAMLSGRASECADSTTPTTPNPAPPPGNSGGGGGGPIAPLLLMLFVFAGFVRRVWGLKSR